MFYYSFISIYSGQALFDSLLIAVFNILFTVLPMIVLGIFDKDMPRDKIGTCYGSYLIGIYNKSFSLSAMKIWVFRGISHSLILFFFLISAGYSITPHGYTEDIFVIGTVLYIAIVFNVNVLTVIEAYEWSFLLLISVFASNFLLLPFLLIYNISHFDMNDILAILLDYKNLIVFITFTCAACLSQSFLYKILICGIEKQQQKVFDNDLYKDRENNELMVKRALQYRKNLEKIFQLKIEKEDNIDQFTDLYQFSSFTLKFNLPYIERRYLLKIIDKNLKTWKNLLKL